MFILWLVLWTGAYVRNEESRYVAYRSSVLQFRLRVAQQPSAGAGANTSRTCRAKDLGRCSRSRNCRLRWLGSKVVSLDTGRVLFEENAAKLLRPASNMKLYTVAAALDRLSPDYRFSTSVYATTRPDAAGVVRGNLTIYGRGDPSIAARFNNGDYFKAIDDLAPRIVAAGVKRVEGDLVGDESYFVGPKYGAGWNWEDLTWYYGAEVTPLTVNDNALDLFIKPGPAVGQPAVITTGPPDPLLTIVNKVITSAKGVQTRDLDSSRSGRKHDHDHRQHSARRSEVTPAASASRIRRCSLSICCALRLRKKAW